MFSLVHPWWSWQQISFVRLSGAVYNAHIEVGHSWEVACDPAGNFVGFTVILQVGVITDHR
jgi:hypothetical protein